MRRSAITIFFLMVLSVPAASQVCTSGFVLRNESCPAGSQTCSTKGSRLTKVEYDDNLTNSILACEELDTNVCLADGTNCPAGVAAVQATAPSSPSSGDLWLDTGESPPVLCVHDGSDWRSPETGEVCAGEEVSPTDWSSVMYLHMKFEDQPAADGYWTNSGTSCPTSDCNVRSFTTPASEQILSQLRHAVFGRAMYLHSHGTDNYRLGCELRTTASAAGRCDGLGVGGGGANSDYESFTASGYFRIKHRSGTDEQHLISCRDSGSSDCWRIQYDENLAEFQFIVGSVTLNSGNGSCLENEWCHVAGTWDSGTDTASLYVNGELADSDATVTAVSEATIDAGNFFRLGNITATDEAWAYVDDVAVGPLMDANEVCRACSVGIDGTAGVCRPSDNTAWEDEGRNDTYCGGCTLPACNAAAP